MAIEDYMDKDPFENVSTIDIRRKKKIFVSLLDKDGDEVEFRETIDQLNRYITDNMMKDETNPLKDEINPLIVKLFTSSLVYSTGDYGSAAFIASQETLRYSITHQMLLSFYFLKFVQKNELKIVTKEEDVTDEEIERIQRINKANSIATVGALMGASPQEIIKELVKSGQLRKEDIAGAFGEESDDDISEDKEKSILPEKTSGTKKPDPNSN